MNRKSSFIEDILFNKFISISSIIIIISSFFIPSEGLKNEICIWKIITGSPCGGCGITRSITSISHMNFSKSFYYHPFGFLFYISLLISGFYYFLPYKYKIKIKEYINKNENIINKIIIYIFYSFISFGLIRFLYNIIKNFIQ